jgi:hypothetical protein
MQEPSLDRLHHTLAARAAEGATTNPGGRRIATVVTILVLVGGGSAGCLPDSTSPTFGYAVFGPTAAVETPEARARARVAAAARSEAAQQETTRARVARVEAQDQAESTHCEETPRALHCVGRLSRELDRTQRSIEAFDRQLIRSLAEPVDGTDIDAVIRHWNRARAEGEAAASKVEQ